METISSIHTHNTEATDILAAIHNINEPIIYEYFIKLNNEEFKEVAELFAEKGCLHPPFDKPIQGREMIAEYFVKEAVGMRFYPQYGEKVTSDSPNSQYHLQGKVETSWFTVNVNWLIEVNSAKEIVIVEVKLLDSLNDLLNLKRD